MDLHILAVSEDSLTLTVGKPWKSKWPTWSLWQNFKEKFEFSLEFSLNSCLFFSDCILSALFEGGGGVGRPVGFWFPASIFLGCSFAWPACCKSRCATISNFWSEVIIFDAGNRLGRELFITKIHCETGAGKVACKRR